MGKIIINTEGDRLMRENSEFVKKQSERIDRIGEGKEGVKKK